MIQIKKRIGLDFLGEEYKEGYLEFNSVAMKDYEALTKKSQALADDPAESIKFVVSFLTDRFIGGKFPQDGELKDVAKEQLPEFDAEVFLKAFQLLTGQLDPKV